MINTIDHVFILLSEEYSNIYGQKSCFSRRERESLTFNLVVRDKIERLKISSHGRARKMEPIIKRIF